MATKLTITIEKSIIERSKKYAASQNRSLSDLIESYLRSITAGQQKKISISSRLKSLKGSISAPKDIDYKKVLQEELLKKHG